jgi:hypothetical protein
MGKPIRHSPWINMRKVHWVSQSSDKKTGSVVASYSPKESCPDSCSLKTGGCYAWGLFYLNILSKKIQNGTIKTKILTDALKERAHSAKIVRHRIAGDVVGDVPQTVEECKIVQSEGLINIGYTHHWRAEEAQPLKGYFRASCSNLEEVMEARQMGWSPTLIVPSGTPKSLTMANGEKAFMCPARHGVEGKKDITCNDCTLCRVDAKTDKKTVMFEVHGNASTLKKIGGKVGNIT